MKFRFGVLITSAAFAGVAPFAGGMHVAQAAEVARSLGAVVDDAVITTKVKSALISDADVKAFDFKVDTRKGVVQLSGFVDSQAQVDRAMALAKSVEGVMRVENKVALKTGGETAGNKLDDGILTTRVKSALLADANVKGLQIRVTSRKGTVQLSGFADSPAQAQRAVEIARGTEGVQSVDNEISLKR